MTEIHRHEVDGAIGTPSCEMPETCRQKLGKLQLAHLARRHCELWMLSLSISTDVTGYSHVERRVGEDNVRATLTHEGGKRSFQPCVATVDSVVPQAPEIPNLRNDLSRLFREFIIRIFFNGSRTYDQIDLRHLEASYRDVNV